MKMAFCPQETAYRGAAQGSESGLERAVGAEGDALVLCTRSRRNMPSALPPIFLALEEDQVPTP